MTDINDEYWLQVPALRLVNIFSAHILQKIGIQYTVEEEKGENGETLYKEVFKLTGEVDVNTQERLQQIFLKLDSSLEKRWVEILNLLGLDINKIENDMDKSFSLFEDKYSAIKSIHFKITKGLVQVGLLNYTALRNVINQRLANNALRANRASIQARAEASPNGILVATDDFLEYLSLECSPVSDIYWDFRVYAWEELIKRIREYFGIITDYDNLRNFMMYNGINAPSSKDIVKAGTRIYSALEAISNDLDNSDDSRVVQIVEIFSNSLTSIKYKYNEILKLLDIEGEASIGVYVVQNQFLLKLVKFLKLKGYLANIETEEIFWTFPEHIHQRVAMFIKEGRSEEILKILNSRDNTDIKFRSLLTILNLPIKNGMVFNSGKHMDRLNLVRNQIQKHIEG
ncbi:MAG: hypothetical protein ABI721_01660 [Candidatus Dojkabacteria bacterium]